VLKLLEVLKLWLKQCSHNGRKFGKALENLQAEISNLRAQVSSGMPTAPKDLFLISLITKWSGTEKSVLCEGGFLSQWSHQP